MADRINVRGCDERTNIYPKRRYSRTQIGGIINHLFLKQACLSLWPRRGPAPRVIYCHRGDAAAVSASALGGATQTHRPNPGLRRSAGLGPCTHLPEGRAPPPPPCSISPQTSLTARAEGEGTGRRGWREKQGRWAEWGTRPAARESCLPRRSLHPCRSSSCSKPQDHGPSLLVFSRPLCRQGGGHSAQGGTRCGLFRV